MTDKEFFHSTLKNVHIRIKSYLKKRKDYIDEMEYQSWLNGIFVMEAIASCFGKNQKYPENPLLNKKTDIKEIANNTGKTQAELIQEEQYFAMRVRQANANIAKSIKQKGGE